MSAKTLTVKVIPNSKINKIVEQHDNFIKIKLTAPALENKANQALIKFLSKQWGIPKNKISLLQGEKSRTKLIKIIEE